MNSAQQGVQFEETRRRIEKNLDALARVSRSNVPPQQFFQKLLEVLVGSLDAQGGAVWKCEETFQSPLTSLRFETSGYQADERQKRWIEAVLHQCAKESKPYVVAAGVEGAPLPSGKDAEDVIANAVPHPFFYHPVPLGNQTFCVVQVWLPGSGDPRTYGDISSFLGMVCGHAEIYLRNYQAGFLVERNQAIQTMLQFQGELLGSLDPAKLLESATNYTVDLLRADFAAAFRKKGREWRLLAASNQEVIDARSTQSRGLSALAATLAIHEQAQQALTSEISPKDQEPSSALPQDAEVKAVVWKHFSSSPSAPRDMLLLAGLRSNATFPENAPQTLDWVTAQLAKAMDAATHFQHLPLRPAVSAIGRTSRAWQQNRRAKVFFYTIFPLLLLAGVLLFPYPWKISVDARVAPLRKAVVVAETSGKIIEVHAFEGQPVRTGETLAKIDDSEHLAQLAVSRQQLLRWKIEASKAQSLGQEAERKIAEVQSAREEEAMRQIELLRAKTYLTSPIDGIVLTRGLEHKRGEAIEVGKVYCEIASAEAFEIELDLPQTEVGVILAKLHAGESIPVSLILHARPDHILLSRLQGAGSVSQIPEVRQSSTVYIARAPMPTTLPEEMTLKPGFTGRAKLTMENKPLGWIWFRPFWNYLRTHWGI